MRYCDSFGGEYSIMKKIDPVVLRETVYVAAWVIVLSALMEAVFLVGGWWDMTVLWGNLLGGGAIMLHFFLLGITVQNALKKEQKEAKDLMKLSLTLRNLLLVAAAVIGFLFDCFNIIALLVPMLFPGIAVKLRPLFMKKEEKAGDTANE